MCIYTYVRMQLSTLMETLKIISRNPPLYTHLLDLLSLNDIYDSLYTFLSSYLIAHMSRVNSFVQIAMKHN